MRSQAAPPHPRICRVPSTPPPPKKKKTNKKKKQTKKIVQLFPIAITGMIFLYQSAASQLQKEHFTSFILLSIDNFKIIYLFTTRLLFHL